MKNNLNIIGLDTNVSNQLSEKLNQLLANYQIFYMNTRGFHWNIKGANFFELHAKFEELYNDLLVKVDEIAERILTLGNTPVHSYSQYIKLSAIQEQTNITGGKEAVAGILASLKAVITLEREILNLASEAGDEGTGALMSDYIREQEKLAWMYNAYLA
ncbi:MAG: Dps family protein [Breznakibacter sp.]|nr:DNA starvation/stationary phase protection protein [Breznakibacter sp.]